MTVDPAEGCVFCEATNRTTWMLTHLMPPATVHSCEAHIDVNLISLLATLHSVDGEWLYGQIEKILGKAVAAAEKQAAAEQAKAESVPLEMEPEEPGSEVGEDEAVEAG